MLIDGEEYFRNLRKAMMQAEHRIMLMGWDFDTRIAMYDLDEDAQGPLELGAFIDWLLKRKPDLHIYMLRWDTGAIKSYFRHKMLRQLVKWHFHPRITLALDGHHPVGAAQHQKIVTIDNDVAFCGGIDITENRWDTRDHAPHQPKRKQPTGTDAGPWHDLAMIMQGDVASALGDFAEHRWKLATGKTLPAVQAAHSCWPHALDSQFNNIDIAIARTEPAMDDQEECREIEQLYLSLIAAARQTLYCESQYFASRTMAKALAQRLAEADGPEIVMINPVSSEGWLEPLVMDSSRAGLVTFLQENDPHDRFRLYHVHDRDGGDIYIHAKIMIVDDQVMRIGSSNFNNRSMGFDTECDVAIEAQNSSATCSKITAIRDDLLAEHLGIAPAVLTKAISAKGSLIAAIESQSNFGTKMRAYATPDISAAEQWLADHNILDPDGTDNNFAPLSR